MTHILHLFKAILFFIIDFYVDASQWTEWGLWKWPDCAFYERGTGVFEQIRNCTGVNGTLSVDGKYCMGHVKNFKYKEMEPCYGK